MLRFRLPLPLRMRALAEETPSDALWERIVGEVGTLPAPTPGPRRRLAPALALIVGVAVLAGGGTVAAQRNWLGWRAPQERRVGPFTIRGYFYGRIERYDARGTLVEVADTSSFPILRSGRYDVILRTPGAVQVRSERNGAARFTPSDARLGALVLRPHLERTTPESNPFLVMPDDPKKLPAHLEGAWRWQCERWRTGTQSIDESPLGVVGYDCRRGLIWSVRGDVEVQVQPLERGAPPQSGGTTNGGKGPVGRAIAAFVADGPVFESLYQGHRQTFRGYGVFGLRGADGQESVRVTIGPAQK